MWFVAAIIIAGWLRPSAFTGQPSTAGLRPIRTSGTQFAKAWEDGAERRDFLRWFNHPFRGFRPPADRCTRNFPRYGHPRIIRGQMK